MTTFVWDLLFADPQSTRIVRAVSWVAHRLAITVGPALLLLMGFALAVVAGLAIAQFGILVLLGFIAVVIGVVAVLRPEVGLFLFTVMLFTRASENLTMSLGVPSTAPLVAVALLTALVAREGLGTLFRTRRVYWMPVIIYGLVLLASVFVAVNKEIVVNNTIIYIKEMVFVAVVVLYARTIRDARTVIWALIIGGLIPSILTIYQTFSGSTDVFFGFGQYSAQIVVPGEVVEVPRPSGHVGDPNFFALSLLILVPLTMHRIRYERSVLLRRMAMVSALILTLAIVLTYSRGAYIALAVMLVSSVIAGYVRLRTVLISLAVVAIVLPVLPESYTQRLTSLFEIAHTVILDEEGNEVEAKDSSYTGRMVQLLAGYHMFLDYPLMGVGSHNYPEHYQEYARQLGTTRRVNRTPHNLFVEIASETGLVGLAAYTLMVGSLAIWLRGVWNSTTQPPELRDLARALAISITGFLAGSVFLHNAYPRFWWMLVALILVTAVVSDERRSLRPTVRMQTIRALSPHEEARVRHRVRLVGGAVAILALALVVFSIVNTRLEAAGVHMLPGGNEVTTISGVIPFPVERE